ncbi:MAG: thiol oxidoreductase, partial [Gemmatimonadota bacterium]|nr:thiol oxidoreductase [Gemmatimonadota bacterium]
FRIYSDLLLHDLGPEVAGTCSPLASPTEWRTAPLVGLGLRQVFLHDGRAQRLGDAVELHGGEAARARETFRSLTPSAREQLLAFLRSL